MTSPAASGPLRLFQAMAGAPAGGAEGFFERLAIALARRGVLQHLAIRRDARRDRPGFRRDPLYPARPALLAARRESLSDGRRPA